MTSEINKIYFAEEIFNFFLKINRQVYHAFIDSSINYFLLKTTYFPFFSELSPERNLYAPGKHREYPR